MVACASPSESSYTMTESTIRFASSVKKIRTKAVQNEEKAGDTISQLRNEIEALRQQLEAGRVGNEQKSLEEQLATTKLLHKNFTETWEEQHAQSMAFERERAGALEQLGLTMNDMASAWRSGEAVCVRKDADPYLVNVCDDPLLSGVLTYTLELDSEMAVGSDSSCDVQIDGSGCVTLTSG